MQPNQNPQTQPTPPDQPQPPRPTTVLGGMTTIQPISNDIVLDPLPERPTPVPLTAPPLPPLAPVVDREANASIRSQLIAFWLIVGFGILITGSAALLLLLEFVLSRTITPGSLVLNGAQIILGLGFIFRNDMMRRILMVFIIISVLLNIYGAIIAASLIGVAPILAAFAIIGKVILPLVTLVILNLKSVRLAFEH